MSQQQNFDQQQLVEILRGTDGYGMTPAQLIHAMDIDPGQRRAFRSWLKTKQTHGLLSKGDAQRMRLRRTQTLRGRLKVSPRGFAFIDGARGVSAFVAPGKFENLLDGDEVQADLVPGRRGFEGINLELIKRHRQFLIGKLIEGHKRWILDPEDRRMEMPVSVDVGETKVAAGDMVRARIIGLEPPVSADASPTLLSKLDKVYKGAGPLSIEVERLLAEQGIEWVTQEAEPGPVPCEDGEAKRIDLTHLPFSTIDPPDARDHDDALFARWNPRGVELFVAIADVAGFVRPGRDLDRYAVARGCSTYLPDRVLPMLPEWISADAASLRAGVDRPVVFMRMVIDYQGVVVDGEWGLGTINSRADLSYDLVQDFIDGKHDALPDDAELRESTTVLAEVARLLMAARSRRGQLEIHSSEQRFTLDEDGEPTGVVVRSQRFAERVVEVCMIAANEEVGRRLIEAKTQAPWRVHGPPKATGLTNFMTIAISLGLRKLEGAPTPAKLNKMMQKLGNNPLKPVLSQLLLRAMSKAEYGAEPEGHWGLSSEHYLHFTSPIRRYPDLLVHRAIRWHLGDRPAPLPVDDDLAQFCADASSSENRSVAVERAAHRLYACRLLQGREGEEFDGIVDGIAAKGIYVRLLDPPVSVMIAREDLGLRSVEFDVAHQKLSWTGGSSLTLGDKLRVRLESVNLAARVAAASTDHLR
ncbi:MAG: RNB domain-containing ribonuclease [Myxococcota bacterium]|nr:RNB domain-containing ribonuclease [Myxococcota bacterium]